MFVLSVTKIAFWNMTKYPCSIIESISWKLLWVLIIADTIFDDFVFLLKEKIQKWIKWFV